MKSNRRAIIVRSKTKVEQLSERFNNESQASFYIQQQRENVIRSKKNFLSAKLQSALAQNKAALEDQVGSGEFDDFRKEHDNYHYTLESVQKKAAQLLKTQTIESQYVPSYLFATDDIIIVVGQDGLVANVAKYVPKIPIIAVNPDPIRFDGILLPFDAGNFDRALMDVLQNRHQVKEVTMGEALLDDGQRLLAFNDFFIGADSHVSAKYQITHEGFTENHSSSGIIVSTGAGSTAWLSSLFNMAICMNKVFGQAQNLQCHTEPWNTRRLVFVVREPFLSKTSQISLGAGLIQEGAELVIESLMPNNGIIFSDGIIKDFIRFNTGSIVRIGIAPEKAVLVV